MKKYILLIFLFACSKQKSDSEVTYVMPAIASSSSPVESIHETKPCKEGMINVSGLYCTKIKENCIKWIDKPELPYARCAKYTKSECIGEKVHKNFCIDKYEYHDKDMMPVTNVSWTEAKQICNNEGKDLCTEEEWNMAALGPEMKPYSYGYDRYPSPCYIEQPKELAVCGKVLCDIRKPVDAFPDCKSDFDVINMNGSVDEFIQVPKYQHSKVRGLYMRSALKGGHAWHNARTRNLPITKDHDESFKMISIGFRCCSKVNE